MQSEQNKSDTKVNCGSKHPSECSRLKYLLEVLPFEMVAENKKSRGNKAVSAEIACECKRSKQAPATRADTLPIE